jgi:hypothetical protein
VISTVGFWVLSAISVAQGIASLPRLCPHAAARHAAAVLAFIFNFIFILLIDPNLVEQAA